MSAQRFQSVYLIEFSSFADKYLVVKDTYSIAEAQARFPRAVRAAEKGIVRIRRRDETVVFLLSREKMEAILESLEILSDSKAMKAIRDYEAGKGKLVSLSSVK